MLLVLIIRAGATLADQVKGIGDGSSRDADKLSCIVGLFLGGRVWFGHEEDSYAQTHRSCPENTAI